MSRYTPNDRSTKPAELRAKADLARRAAPDPNMPGSVRGWLLKRADRGERLAAEIEAILQSAPLWLGIDDDERKIIHNALGLLYSKIPNRSHYCAPRSGPTRERCEWLTEVGLLEKGNADDGDGQRMFYVTADGAAMLGHKLPKD